MRWFCCCWSIVLRTSNCLWDISFSSLFYYALLCVHTCFAIPFKRKRTLVAFLLLSYRCIVTVNEPRHGISNNVVCATSKASDHPAHTRSLITAFASRLNILWVLATDWTSFGTYKLNKRLRMLIGVYTCQNITFLEITCRGSNVLWLFLTVPWVDLQCVIVVFPGHTHLLF